MQNHDDGACTALSLSNRSYSTTQQLLVGALVTIIGLTAISFAPFAPTWFRQPWLMIGTRAENPMYGADKDGPMRAGRDNGAVVYTVPAIGTYTITLTDRSSTIEATVPGTITFPNGVGVNVRLADVRRKPRAKRVVAQISCTPRVTMCPDTLIVSWESYLDGTIHQSRVEGTSWTGLVQDAPEMSYTYDAVRPHELRVAICGHMQSAERVRCAKLVDREAGRPLPPVCNTTKVPPTKPASTFAKPL